MKKKNCTLYCNKFLGYTVLNFVDKGLNILVPILILMLFDDKVYSEIEYLISCSLLFSGALDFGYKSYSFFDYKNRGCRSIDSLSSSIYFMFIINVAIFLLCFVVFRDVFFLICLFRVLYLLFINVFSSFYRLTDNPSCVFIYSISFNLIQILFIYIYNVFSFAYSIYVYIFIYFAFGVYIICGSLKKMNKHFLKSSLLYTLRSLIFSWPCLITLITATLQQNFLKLYGYGKISDEEFSSLALSIRACSIIWLVHASILGFYSKSLYMGGSDRSIFIKYVFSLILIVLGLFVLRSFMIDFNNVKILEKNNFLLLCLFYLFYCFRSYFEVYFGRINKLKFIALFSVIGILSFFLMFYIVGLNVNINSLLIIQLMSEFIIGGLMLSYFVVRKYFV